jgi:hypothetical protein
VWHNKDPSQCSKALSAEHRPKFAALSPAMVTATRKIAHVAINKQTNKQKDAQDNVMRRAHPTELKRISEE